MATTTMHDELAKIKLFIQSPQDRSYILGCLHTLESLSTDCAPDVKSECRALINEMMKEVFAQ